jgi:transposase-like protein
METPKTLLEAINFFSIYENCRQFMIAIRWADGIVRCPYCDATKLTYLEKARVYRCYSDHAKQKFSLKIGTIFEDSPIGLEKWLPATWLLSNCKNGISSYELARAVGVTQKSAWFMLQRIRTAMKDDSVTLMGNDQGGAVEVDEAFVGGKFKNMHKGRIAKIRADQPIDRMEGYGTRLDNKTPVLGMFDRESRQVRAKVVKNVKRETLQAEILNNISYGSQIFTDQAVKYDGLKAQYVHDTVNHAVEYVRGQVHTNSLENFWSLMKRNLSGTYVAVEPFHLDRYLDEQMFRFNNRINKNDSQRFKKVMSQVTGKRLTYAEVTGKSQERPF